MVPTVSRSGLVGLYLNVSQLYHCIVSQPKVVQTVSKWSHPIASLLLLALLWSFQLAPQSIKSVEEQSTSGLNWSEVKQCRGEQVLKWSHLARRSPLNSQRAYSYSPWTVWVPTLILPEQPVCLLLSSLNSLSGDVPTLILCAAEWVGMCLLWAYPCKVPVVLRLSTLH